MRERQQGRSVRGAVGHERAASRWRSAVLNWAVRSWIDRRGQPAPRCIDASNGSVSFGFGFVECSRRLVAQQSEHSSAAHIGCTAARESVRTRTRLHDPVDKYTNPADRSTADLNFASETPTHRPESRAAPFLVGLPPPRQQQLLPPHRERRARATRAGGQDGTAAAAEEPLEHLRGLRGRAHGGESQSRGACWVCSLQLLLIG